jgi:RNA polymerase sigma-70 factor (ECF subfamily)
VSQILQEDDPGQEWMLAFKSGDLKAFDQIVLHFESPVRRFIRRFLRDTGRAEDLAQEAFVRVFHARRRYQPSARFRTWLFTIVTRLCLNEIRAEARRRKVFIPLQSLQEAPPRPQAVAAAFGDSKSETPAQRLERRELEEVLDEGIRSLPESQRLAMLLVRHENFSYLEIAERLGVSLMAVKSLINRAREAMRARLNGYLEGKNQGQAPVQEIQEGMKSHGTKTTRSG